MAGIHNIIDQSAQTTNSKPSLSVSQLNFWMKGHIEGATSNLRVYGEVSNVSRPRSGHLYFTLKDQNAEITCVMFRTYAMQCQAENIVYHGAAIEIEGQVTLYAPRGQYQFVASKAYLYGEGRLRQEYLLLEKKLADEGLFDTSNKRSLPKHPEQIGVISSPSAAGLQDFIKVMLSRFPLCKIRLYPALVQGKQAAASLCQALTKASCATDLDAIVLCRGGGSLEDMWCFNDPDLARALFSCPIPTVNAVGHEIDHTIADKVADIRAATPTQAAVLLTPNQDDISSGLIQRLSQLQQIIHHILSQKTWALHHARQSLTHPSTRIQQQRDKLLRLDHQLNLHISYLIQHHKQQVSRLRAHLSSSKMRSIVQLTITKLHHLLERVQRSQTALIQAQQEKIYHLSEKLHTVNPQNLLQKGYVIAKKNGKALVSAKKLSKGDRITMIFHDGTRDLIVTS